MQRLYQVVEHLSSKYCFEPESEDHVCICRINDARAQCIHRRTRETIALDCQPFSVTEDKGFRQ